MKKRFFIIFMVSFLLLTLVVPCIAADRWMYLCGNEITTWYFDTQSYATSGKPDNRRIECWIKTVLNKDGCYVLSHNWIDYKRNGTNISRVLYFTKEVTAYNPDGTYQSTMDEANQGWRSPTPGSIFETVIRKIIIDDARRMDKATGSQV